MVRALALPWINDVRAVCCGTERKARDSAHMLAEHLGLPVAELTGLAENDRSATGYLPQAEFKGVADLFFAHPNENVHGWKRAVDAQRRIISAIEEVLNASVGTGDVAVVAHGGVGTLLLCRNRTEPGLERSGVNEHMLFTQRETPDQPDVQVLLSQADERSASLYPEDSRNGLDVSALLALDARFFVARQDGRALGCGGYVLLADGTAEVKRLFVDLAARANGVGGGIVRAIERAAMKEGVGTLMLETGIKSVEALHLYKRLGFAECGPFAAYRPDPLSVFMMKRLVTQEAVAELGNG